MNITKDNIGCWLKIDNDFGLEKVYLIADVGEASVKYGIQLLPRIFEKRQSRKQICAKVFDN